MAKEKNAWKPTPVSLLRDIQKACVEHGHGGLWNSDNDTRDVVCIDMKACYPASFQGMGEAKPYFERFGHPSHHMTRVAINGALPRDIGTGFAEVQEWEFEANCHPVILAWFGRHFADAGWAPTPLLVFLVESGLLKTLKVREAIVSFGRQTEVWLPDSRDEAAVKPRERSSSSAREIPSSSPRPIAWPKRCGPGASRPRPTTASSDGVAKRNGHLKGWGGSSFPV